jgi:GAF domain-containing protein
MERRERAFREFGALVRERDRPFADRVEDGLALGREALDVEYGALARVDDGEHTVLAVAATEGIPTTAGDRQPLADTFCELPVLRREVVAFGRADDGPAGAADRPSHESSGFESYLGAPVTVDARVYGTVCFAGHEGRDGFDDWEHELVESLAAWVSDGLTARARKLALGAERDRFDGFVAMIDHDIREPLTAARGHARLAQESAAAADDAETARHAEETVTALSRTDRLVTDLLRLASDSERAGGAAPVDVRTAAEHAWTEVVDDDAAARLLAEAGVRVPADESLLKRLLAESFRFCLDTADDGLQVRLGSLGDRPGFFVADDGQGFPGESADRPADDGEGLDGIERIAAAHDWEITAGLSADGGIRIEVETDEGLWPTARAATAGGPFPSVTDESDTEPVSEQRDDTGSHSGSGTGSDRAESVD